MPLGIRPTNDFAFKKTFGSPENKQALISLLNAILELSSPIVDVTIENPFSQQDFQDDKLSILDVKAIDQSGSIYNIEMQLTVHHGLVQRIVFYGCEIYADQLKAGEDYSLLKPACSICLIDGLLWRDSPQLHHAFRFTDQESGRTLKGTVEIHTLELGKYNVRESELANSSLLECWLYWLLHAHEYEADDLLRLFPQQPIQLATQSLSRIAQITEDKTMYDAREKAIRDQQWALDASFREGEVVGEAIGEARGRLEGQFSGEINLIRTLQELLGEPLSAEAELLSLDLPTLRAHSADLQKKLRSRTTS